MILIIVLLISISGNLLCWAAYYPGGFNLDAYGQWMQINGDLPYNNWHPFFITGIYWLLTRIVNNLAFCIFFQILLFSFSFSVLIYKVEKWSLNKWLVILIAFVVAFNPAVELNNVCLIKDVYFTIEMMWSWILLIDVYNSNGEVLEGKGKYSIVLISIVMILTRHNAYFYVFPMLIMLGVVWKTKWKSVLLITATAIISVIIIEGPIYSFINVEPHDNPKGEVIGIPMAVMANALTTDPENTPEEVKEFLLDIADYEFWEENYITGEWDSVKWDIDSSRIFHDKSLVDIFILAIKTAGKCPRAAFESVLWNTRVVWQIVGKSEWSTEVYIEDNIYGIKDGGLEDLKIFFNIIISFSETLIGSTIIWNLGGYILIIVLSMLYYSRNNKKILVFDIPLLSYVFLTMLLLCGPSYRYFYMLPVIIWPNLLLHIQAGNRKMVMNGRN